MHTSATAPSGTESVLDPMQNPQTLRKKRSKILFFFQFGIFIFCTIGFSIVYALVVFTIIIGIIGPEGDKGSLMHMVGFFKSIGRKRDDDPSNTELTLHVDSQSTLSKDSSEENLNKTENEKKDKDKEEDKEEKEKEVSNTKQEITVV